MQFSTNPNRNIMIKKIFERLVLISIIVFNIACEKQQDFDSKAKIKGLTIKASDSPTVRTSFDSSKTQWSNEDMLNVHISGGDYETPQSKIFTLSNSEQAEFTNPDVELSTGTEYNFHAIYPSSAAIDSSTKSVSLNIGAATQIQDRTLPTAHIAALDPLYGHCTATPEAVSIPMKHTAALFKLNIQNATENEITVKSVKITAPTGVAIAGMHTVNLETGTITPSATDGDTSRTIVLTLNTPATIAQNGNFTAWIAAAPFVIAKGGSLLFTVTDNNDNQYDIIKSFADGHTFASGKIASTTLEINAENKVTTGQEKEVTLDFTVAGNLSPSSNSETPVTDLLYKSGIYISYIHATNKCYYDTEYGAGLLLNVIKDDNFATITLPQLSGYKIKKITFNNARNEQINATIELYNNDNRCRIVEVDDPKKGYSVNIVKREVSFSKIVGITDDSQYYIKFIAANNVHHIKSWVITYQRM